MFRSSGRPAAPVPSNLQNDIQSIDRAGGLVIAVLLGLGMMVLANALANVRTGYVIAPPETRVSETVVRPNAEPLGRGRGGDVQIANNVPTP